VADPGARRRLASSVVNRALVANLSSLGLREMPALPDKFCGGSRDNVIENHLVVECPESVWFDKRVLTLGKKAFFETMNRNLQAAPCRQQPWSGRYPQLLTLLHDDPGAPKGNTIRNNVVWSSGALLLAPEVTQYGTVAGNLVTDDDLKFGHPAAMDFRLARNSPALRRLPGFQPVPFQKIGIDGV
jgi:hypothetical protein